MKLDTFIVYIKYDKQITYPKHHWYVKGLIFNLQISKMQIKNIQYQLQTTLSNFIFISSMWYTFSYFL